VRIDSFSPARLAPPTELPGARELPGTASMPANTIGAPETRASGTFSELLTRALGRVNDNLQTADAQAQRVATGEAENLHDPLIAMAEADLALQVTMRVTQKAIAAYQEISRMQL